MKIRSIINLAALLRVVFALSLTELLIGRIDVEWYEYGLWCAAFSLIASAMHFTFVYILEIKRKWNSQ